MAQGLTQAQIVERIERLEKAVNELVEQLERDGKDAVPSKPPAGKKPDQT
jgi:hypothetical protein